MTAQVLRLLTRYGFGPCSHPDCGGSGSCATDYIHRRAAQLVERALRETTKKPHRVLRKAKR